MTAELTGSHTISGLVAKRAEITGQIEALQVQLRTALIALEALDSVIRLFDSDYAIENIRPKRVPAIYKSFPGDTVRLVIGFLNETGGPLSTKQITAHVMVARGTDTTDRAAFELFRGRVGALLRHYRAKGLLRSFPADDGQVLLWDLVGKAK